MSVQDARLSKFRWLLHSTGFGVLAAIGMAVWVFAFQPMQDRILSTEQQSAALERFLGRTRSIVSREIELKEQLAESRKALSELQSRVPTQQKGTEFLEQLDQLAEDADLTILDYTQGLTTTTTSHSEFQIEMTAVGNYDSLWTFSNGLVKLPRLCRIRRMKIQTTEDNGDYSIDLSLSIYHSDSASFARLPAATSPSLATRAESAGY